MTPADQPDPNPRSGDHRGHNATVVPGILAGYETPERVVFAAALPDTVGGEIREHELRSELA